MKRTTAKFSPFYSTIPSTGKEEPSLIFCADMHLRDSTPICRTDDYDKAQWSKVDSIAHLQTKYNCPVIHTGDLFHHWKPSPWLLRETIKHLPKQFFTVYGNHDLPQHNLSLASKSGIGVLEEAKALTVLGNYHWGQTPTKEDGGMLGPGGRIICVWHILTYQGRLPWPGCTAPSALTLLKRYPKFDVIVTGDNHKSFVEEYKGRILVNPGSLMRMSADQLNHQPKVYLWYAKTNKVKPVILPYTKDVISREHLDQKKERDGRIDSFISKLDGDWKVDMSFEQNLQRFEKANNISPNVMKIIYKAIE